MGVPGARLPRRPLGSGVDRARPELQLLFGDSLLGGGFLLLTQGFVLKLGFHETQAGLDL